MATAAASALHLDEELIAAYRRDGAVLVKGLTTLMLLTKLRAVGKGDVCLVHAAAGGVGQLLCQWARHLGATVIGTVGSAAKAAFARAHGCDEVILYTKEDFAAHIHGDLLRQVTIGYRGSHIGDVAHLRRQVARHKVDVIGEIFPGASHAGHLRLPTQPAFGAYLARHTGTPGA